MIVYNVQQKNGRGGRSENRRPPQITADRTADYRRSPQTTTGQTADHHRMSKIITNA